MKRVDKSSYFDLLADIARGDEQAFSKLYDLFYPSLLQYVITKVSDQSTAEDILHDLFLSVWKSRHRIQEIEALPAYLFTSSRYLVIEHIKKSSLWSTNEDLADIDIHDQETPLEDRLYFRYLLDKVHEEIENLPEKCKQIFKLSREDYKSNKEIAEYLGISESTVENQINRALKRLKGATKNLFIFCMLLP